MRPALTASGVRRSSRIRPLVEELETRTLLSASPTADPLVAPLLYPASPGYTPTQIKQIYGFSSNPTAGAGQTIAIVDAYNDPTIAADLNYFISAKMPETIGKTSFSLQVVNQTGGSTLPATNTGWASEIALDVEWAHAIAPGANILLVEANSNSFTDLFAAVDYAGAHASVVSMSWGGSDLGATFDSHFNVPGVTFVASSGDTGGKTGTPATSSYVVAVGGTSLQYKVNVDTSYARSSETVWSGSGGGVSRYEAKPSYQSGLSYNTRAVPDVAYDADPYTGFAVYDTTGGSGWGQWGGTSAGAPQWAALIAIVDQQRVAASKETLSSLDTLNALYKLVPASDFFDITAGSAGRNRAGKGYDLATGLGSPNLATKLITDLATLAVNVGGSPASLPSGGGKTRPAHSSALATGGVLPTNPADTAADALRAAQSLAAVPDATAFSVIVVSFSNRVVLPPTIVAGAGAVRGPEVGGTDGAALFAEELPVPAAQPAPPPALTELLPATPDASLLTDDADAGEVGAVAPNRPSTLQTEWTVEPYLAVRLWNSDPGSAHAQPPVYAVDAPVDQSLAALGLVAAVLNGRRLELSAAEERKARQRPR